MSLDDTLYARDDEMDEFGDSGAYGDSLEEDYEEEEEEEEAEVAGVIEPQPEPATPAVSVSSSTKKAASTSTRSPTRPGCWPSRATLCARCRKCTFLGHSRAR